MRLFMHLMLAAALMPLAALSTARAQGDPTVYMVSYLEVAPASKSQAATALRQLAEGSRKEAGALRFEVLQRTTENNQFVVLEAWKDRAAFDAHGAAASQKQFRDKITPMLLSPIDDRESIATAVGAMPSAGARGSIYVVTHVDVGPPNREKCIAMLTPFAEQTRKEPGNLRYEAQQMKARTNHFTTIEVWKDQKSESAHEIASKTKEFRTQLYPLTGALYDQRFYKAL